MGIIDLVGSKYGSVVVLRREGWNKHGAILWVCQCKCGNEIKATRSNLLRRTELCLCIFKENPTGLKFNKLTVLREGTTRGVKRYWECICDCGSLTTATYSQLVRGNKKSCGCLRDEVARVNQLKTHPRVTTHGMSTSSEYRAWVSAKSRCCNEKNPKWKDYGGRGIKMFEGWLNDFQAFYEYVGPKLGPEYSLDRINVNGNYGPGNVRWATKKEQAINTRSRIFNSIVLDLLVQWKQCYGDTTSGLEHDHTVCENMWVQ